MGGPGSGRPREQKFTKNAADKLGQIGTTIEEVNGFLNRVAEGLRDQLEPIPPRIAQELISAARAVSSNLHRAGEHSALAEVRELKKKMSDLERAGKAREVADRQHARTGGDDQPARYDD